MTRHLANILMSGVFHAAILFLVSAGLQVVFGVQKIFNLACGSFYALGAYVGVSAVGLYSAVGGPPAFFIVPLVVAGLAVGLVGWVVERGLLRFVYDRDETFQLLLTFALVLMMEDLIRMTWGTAPASTAGLYLVSSAKAEKLLDATVYPLPTNLSIIIAADLREIARLAIIVARTPTAAFVPPSATTTCREMSPTWREHQPTHMLTLKRHARRTWRRAGDPHPQGHGPRWAWIADQGSLRWW